MIGATEIVIAVGLGALVAYFVKEIKKNKKEAAELKDRMDNYVPTPTDGTDEEDNEEEL